MTRSREEGENVPESLWMSSTGWRLRACASRLLPFGPTSIMFRGCLITGMLAESIFDIVFVRCDGKVEGKREEATARGFAPKLLCFCWARRMLPWMRDDVSRSFP